LVSPLCEGRWGAATVDIFVGPTDSSWFDFLAAIPSIDEVNFWKPSSKDFRAIRPGERFAFKLKAPRNAIGGFGVLAESSVLPIATAWEAFGIKNGVPSLEAFVAAIAQFRVGERVTPSTFIGCRILVEPIFLRPEEWLAPPTDWSPNIVGGKSYSTNDLEGANLWDRLDGIGVTAVTDLGESEQARFGEPTLVTPRLGQGAFRVVITELYGRQCALTDGRVLPALDAAHIVPYSDGGTHSKTNGILLRKDIHSVFDAGYATLDSDYRFVVSQKVREVFNNGSEYLRLHGTRLRLPANPLDYPDKAGLRWHNDQKFEK
jgi:putative restriction endonuclease